MSLLRKEVLLILKFYFVISRLYYASAWSNPVAVLCCAVLLPVAAADKKDRSRCRCAALDAELDYVVAGGGSDANIFNSFGIQCAILATGMDKVHSTQETITLSDMALTADLVMAILA